MSNVRKRASAIFASVAMAVASLAATPAPAQTGGDGYGPGQPCSPWSGGFNGLECCYYPGQGWFYYYNVVGGGFCGGYYYEAPEEPADRPAEEPAESPGQ